jgi:multidrug resistance efflux pump
MSVESPLKTAEKEASTADPTPIKRMIKLRPSEALGDKFPAIHLVRSSWFARSLANMTFTFLVLLAVACIFVPWQQTSRCEGEVVARNPNERRQEFVSRAKGIIKDMIPGLQEGSYVKGGETIMVLETLARDQVEQIRSQVQQQRDIRVTTDIQRVNARAQVENVRESGNQTIKQTDFEIDAAIAKLKQTEAAVEEQIFKVRQANLEVEANKPLVGGLVSRIEFNDLLNKLEQETRKLTKAEATFEEAEKLVASKRNERESKRQDIEKKVNEALQKVDDFTNKIAEIDNKIQEYNMKLGELERLIIVSPTSGYVQSILVQLGMTVDTKDKLFELIPDTDDLWVELNVRGLDQPLIHIGDHVRLQFDGWPAIQFVGWPSVARGTFGGVVKAINPADDRSGNFKIFVGPDLSDPMQESWPDRRYLKQGVRANAWVIMDSVPLGYEIWRQLNGFPLSRSKGGTTEEPGKEVKGPKLPK